MTENYYPNSFHLNDYFNWIESRDLPRTDCPPTNHAVWILEIFHFTVDVWVTRHPCFCSSYWVISSFLPEGCAGNNLWLKSGVAGLSWVGPSQKQVETGLLSLLLIHLNLEKGRCKAHCHPLHLCVAGVGSEVRGRWIQYATQITVSPKIPRVEFLHFYVFVQYN